MNVKIHSGNLFNGIVPVIISDLQVSPILYEASEIQIKNNQFLTNESWITYASLGAVVNGTFHYTNLETFEIASVVPLFLTLISYTTNPTKIK